MNRIDKDLILYTLKKTSPVLIGYFFLGIGFGILLEKAGYGLLECLVMSTFIYSGSMQYVAVDLFVNNASLINTFFTTLIINARYFFYSLSLVEKYKDKDRKLYMIHTITDEAYALISENEYLKGYREEDYWFLVSCLDQLYWVISTLIGVLIGYLITFEIKGIDFVMTALFITIFVDQWIKSKNHLPSIMGIIVPIIIMIIFGKDNFLLLSIIIVAIFSSFYEVKDE